MGCCLGGRRAADLMPTSRVIFSVVLTMLAVIVLVAPVAKAVVDATLEAKFATVRHAASSLLRVRDVGEGTTYEFGRVLRRLLMLVLVVLLVLWRKSLRVGEVTRGAFLPARSAMWHGLAGFLGGGLFLLAFVCLLWLFGGCPLRQDSLPLAGLVRRLPGILGAALLTSVIEEWLFRGVVFDGLRREMRLGWAVLAAAVLFALAHLTGIRLPVEPGIDPLVGGRFIMRAAAACLEVPWLLSLVFLTLVGAILCLTRTYSGTIYLAIGLHAGGILLLKVFPLYFQAVRTPGLDWFFGYRPPIGGVLGIGLLAIVVLVLAVGSRGRRQSL